METDNFLQRTVYLPSIRFRSGRYRQATDSRPEFDTKRRRNSGRSGLRKEELDLLLLRQLFASHQPQQLDLSCYFNPEFRSTSVLAPFVSLTPSLRSRALEQLKQSSLFGTQTQYDRFSQQTLLPPPVVAKNCMEMAPAGLERHSDELLLSQPGPKMQRRNKTSVDVSGEMKTKKPGRTVRYNQMYDKIMALFSETEGPSYSEAVQKGVERVNFQRNEREKIQIMYTSRRLELPKHAKAKFSQNTQRKFMMQTTLGKAILGRK